ncbi:protein OSB1, mitochondrial-like isoform X2 [Malania oleifera]|uniref:protein OSB1, mitochondrial-like isoform X2 n=1 Tax=Malania oleifera TaxID=397392 RepID=UPI0025AE70FC|nr:protein OSB1, mitochondrial-like isoform X2 [Malania oleifera]
MGLCRRLCVIIRKASPYSLQRPVPFSSTGSAGSPRTSDSFPEDSDGGGGSAVYRRALKFQRPTVIKWQDRLYNSVSFIGTVELPVKITATRHGSFGVHTMLSVKTSRESNHTLRIFLKMWDNLAEIAIKHLKPNDFIYVSGSLGSYEKSDANGKLRIYYEVTVKELNYVVPRGQGQISQKYENSESRGTILKCIDAGYFQMMTLKQVNRTPGHTPSPDIVYAT